MSAYIYIYTCAQIFARTCNILCVQLPMVVVVVMLVPGGGVRQWQQRRAAMQPHLVVDVFHLTVRSGGAAC